MKKIATLEIWRPETPEEIEQHGITGVEWEDYKRGEFRIIDNPEWDKKHETRFGHRREEILAHELGHFLGHLMDLPAHKDFREKFESPEGFLGVKQSAKEKEAWGLAKIIYPGLREDIVEYVLGQYAKGDRYRML